ncbi:MAG: CoA-binding protein [Acidimicrobiales bacterium]
MISTATVNRFLAEPRITVVGASDAKGSFGGTVYRSLRDHGYDVVAVHPTAATVAGDPCYPDLAHVHGPIRAVLVMVNATAALDVVDACIAREVDQVWLFRGLGGDGAVSDDAVRRLREHGVSVVAGACPLMFLEPVGLVHRIHRRMRRIHGSLSAA